MVYELYVRVKIIKNYIPVLTKSTAKEQKYIKTAFLFYCIFDRKLIYIWVIKSSIASDLETFKQLMFNLKK